MNQILFSQQQIEVKDKQELRQIMQKVRAMKITTSCKRNINEK